MTDRSFGYYLVYAYTFASCFGTNFSLKKVLVLCRSKPTQFISNKKPEKIRLLMTHLRDTYSSLPLASSSSGMNWSTYPPATTRWRCCLTNARQRSCVESWLCSVRKYNTQRGVSPSGIPGKQCQVKHLRDAIKKQINSVMKRTSG